MNDNNGKQAQSQDKEPFFIEPGTGEVSDQALSAPLYVSTRAQAEGVRSELEQGNKPQGS